jgi:hypothetical protein
MRWNTIPSILQWGSIADLCCLLPPGNPLAPGWPGPKVAAWISVVVAALRVALVSPLWQRELHLHLSLKHAHRLVLHSPSCNVSSSLTARASLVGRPRPLSSLLPSVRIALSRVGTVLEDEDLRVFEQDELVLLCPRGHPQPKASPSRGIPSLIELLQPSAYLLILALRKELRTLLVLRPHTASAEPR